MLYCQWVPNHGLDAEKLEVLRRWGGGLHADEREEVAAAGRAILLLIEEIERLHVLVWDRKLYPDEPVLETTPAGGAESLPDELSHGLRERLRRRFSPT